MHTLRLAVFLLDAQHAVKAAALAEGSPRYAVKKALLAAARLDQVSKVADSRLVILPAPPRGLYAAARAAGSASKAGNCLRGMGGIGVGRSSILERYRGLLAQVVDSVRCARAQEVTRVAPQALEWAR